MNPKNCLKTISAISALFLAHTAVNAQFGWMWDGPTLSYRMARFNPALNIRSFGVGNFTPFNRPQSALHINTNIITGNPDFNAGEVFRTDAPAANTTSWRMLRGSQRLARLQACAQQLEARVTQLEQQLLAVKQ